MMDRLFDLLAGATLVSSAAITFIFVLRPVARRLLDSRLAYACWLLVPAVVLAVLVPRPAALPAMPFEGSLPAITTGPVADALPLAPQGMQAGDWLLLWLAGALATFCMMTVQQRRFARELGALTPSDGSGIYHANTPGPLLIGLFNPKVVLPSDAASRYGPDELQLVVAHERVHARRGDLWANAVCAALQVTFWFNPVVHVAARLFRYDQEVACDETVLAQFPGARRAYASAIMKTQLSSQGAPLVANWHTDHPLKGRIMRLNANQAGSLRRMAGKITLAALVASACSGVWAYAGKPAESAQKVDVSARIAFAGNPEKAVVLKGVDFPGTPLKADAAPDCQYTMGLAPYGEAAAFVDIKIQCGGTVVAHPKIATKFGEQGRIAVSDANGRPFSISVTVTKAAEK